MPRILPLTDENISDETKSAFEKHVREHQSRITNMKATMGRSVLAFEIYMRWYNLYENVKKITGERLAYLFAHAISSGSNCPLCTTYFRKVIIENGEKPEALVLTEDEQTLLDFGIEISIHAGRINEELYQRVAKKYSEEEIIVLVAFAGQMIATNVFSNTFDIEIDNYLAPYTPLTKK
ncbi:MAG: hypothetical protein NTY88_03150 [Bacteroidetes bacterium]|nr:hypothetical protein [Bacteroidota bacterium]